MAPTLVKTLHRNNDWSDYFCGGGGSSTGIKNIRGARVRLAANHWNRAIETHQENHPETDHMQANISNTDPRAVKRTRFAWWSPSCTNHSGAKGARRVSQLDMFEEYVPDEAAERSRATMWDVVQFTEYHGYDYLIVENVVEVTKWNKYPMWIAALEADGYVVQIVCLNSAFAHQGGLPAPQLRDRWYAVCSRKGLPIPDVQRWTRPSAWCATCEEWVRAIQAWKDPSKRVGKYGRGGQYVYRCPSVTCRNSEVVPPMLPAASVIDFTDLGTLIGDRDRPLAANTLRRIEHRLDRIRGGEASPEEPWITELRGGGSLHRGVTHPLATFAASGTHHGLTTPPGFLMRNNGTKGDLSWTGKPFHEPMATLTTKGQQAVVTWAGLYGYDTGHLRSLDRPLPTQTTIAGDALMSAEKVPLTAAECHFRMLAVPEIGGGMAFPSEYVLIGNETEKVKLLGNAVTPPTSRDLGACVMEAANGSVEFEAAA